MADENITSADTQEGSEQQANDAQLLDDLTSLQQATEGMDDAQADGQVATNNEGDADNPSMTRPDNEFKDQRGLPEGGTTDPFALDNTDLENSNEQSTTTDTQFTAQNTNQDAAAVNLDNVQIQLEGAEGQEGSSGTTGGTTSGGTSGAPGATAAPTAAPTTLTDPADSTSASPTPTDSPPTDTTTPPDTIIPPSTTTPPTGSEDSDGGENSSTQRFPEFTIAKSGVLADAGSTADEAGDVINYTVTITNTGNTALENVVVSDAKFVGAIVSVDGVEATVTSAGSITIPTIAFDAEVKITYSYTVSQTDIDTDGAGDGLIENEVSANAIDVTGTKVDSWNVDVVRTPELSIEKTAVVADNTSLDASDFANDAAANTVDSVGDTVTYTITVSNTGNTTLDGVTFTDPMLKRNAGVGELYEVTLGDNPDTANTETDFEILTETNVATGGVVTVGELAVGATKTYQFVYTVQQSDINSNGDDTDDEVGTDGAIKNVVEAESSTDGTEKQTADYTFNVVRTPELSVWKSGQVYNDLVTISTLNSVDSRDDFVKYNVIMQNTGNQELTNLTLSDSKIMSSLTQVGTVGAAVKYGDINASTLITFRVGTVTVNGSFEASVPPVTVEGIVSAGGLVTLDPEFTLAVGQALELSYIYDVSADDMFGASINNIVQVGSDQTSPEITDNPNSATDGIASYEVTVSGYADVAIRKLANVTYVAGAGSEIEYSLIVTNEGSRTLSGVYIEDDRFSADTIFTATLHNADGSEADYEVSYANGSLYLGNSADATDTVDLDVGQYVTIKYTYTVQEADFEVTPTGVTDSIVDYVSGKGPQGHSIDFSYGTFSAFVDLDSTDPYSTVNAREAQVFVNVDNTGVAVGVNAGVMSGDRNYHSDHLVAEFESAAANGGLSIVDTASIVFTNATSCEVAFKVNSRDVNGVASDFTGSVLIKSQGTGVSVTLHKVSSSYSLDGTTSHNIDKQIFSSNEFPGFTVAYESGPGGSQNILYTLSYNPGTNAFIDKFDFWVVGDIGSNSLEQIKVVDVQFNTLDFEATAISNTAIVYSNEDDDEDQSDEISTIDTAVLVNLSSSAAAIFNAIDPNLDPNDIRDTTAPTATVSIDAIQTDSGSSDFITTDQTLIVSGTLSEALGFGDKVLISSDNLNWHVASVNGINWTYDDTAVTRTSDFTYYAKVVDAAGNVGNIDSQLIRIVEGSTTERDGKVTVTYSGNPARPTATLSNLIFDDSDGAVSITKVVWYRKGIIYATVEGGETQLELTLADGNHKSPEGVTDYYAKVFVKDPLNNQSIFTTANFAIKDNSGSNSNVTIAKTATPIALDLNNDGIEYLSTSAGVTYDYNGDGVAESTAWVSPEDGLLALSQEDGSFKIVFSTQDGETDLQGLARIYDSNQDGHLDELDTFFNQFGVWQDADSDGVVDSGEFQSLTDRDIVSLDLVSDGIERTEAGGDVFVYGQTTYTKADGTTGQADDAAFVVRSIDQESSNTIQIGNAGEVVYVPDFGTNDQIDLSTILANAAITRDNLKDYVQLVDGENGTVLNIDTSGHGGEGGWVQVASLDNVHVSQTGVNMFFDPTHQTIDFTQSSPNEWKVEDGDTPV